MKRAFSHPVDHQVKKDFEKRLKANTKEVLRSAKEGVTVRWLEERIWAMSVEMCQGLMSCALNILCRQSTEKDIAERGLSRQNTKLRNESDYWYQLMTTFGPVRFFSYAYRDMSNVVGTVTRVPASEEVVPLHKKTRSSELCLEWESRLGSEHPFRKAQESLSYFTHGAVQLEDTTIARHMVTAAKLIDPGWLYRNPAEIRTILEERGTRDARTGQPILYLSTDAHALRRYVDDTWDAQWKMANGIRLWCVDRNNGAIIHIGGEYTWGDCQEVADIIERLVSSGHLAEDGDYGDGTSAKLVVVTDGAPWIENHVLPLLPWAVPILDAYHALEHIGEYVVLRFGKGSKEARDFYDRAAHHLLGKTIKGRRKNKKRKNHRKRPRRMSRSAAVIKNYSDDELTPRRMTGPEKVLEMLILDSPRTKKHRKSRLALINYVEENLYRMDYVLYRTHGYQIGSGAMESLHRTASQARLKIPGGRWLEETSQAIFNLRMMAMVGKWDAFWHQPGITDKLVAAFSGTFDEADWGLQEVA
jgi:hypothetical protein